MYGKEFSSPQQTLTTKLDQYSENKNMRASVSHTTLKNQQPTNLPSKYPNKANNSQNNSQQRPISAQVNKSQSQKNFQGNNQQNFRYGSFKSPEQVKQMNQYNGNTQSRFLQQERDKNMHRNNDYYQRQSNQQQSDTQSQSNHNRNQSHYHQDEIQSRGSIISESQKSSKNPIHLMNTQKFLKSNLNEYLKQDEGRCISCSECMKTQDKNISYKYPQHLKSNYIDEYSKFDPNAKSKEFNLDKEKLRLKVPYKVARDFTSTHQAEFKPFQVQPKQSKKDEEDFFELNHPCFIGSTTYNKTFQNWGAAPAMKPAKQQPHIIDMKIQDKTTYKETYNGDQDKMPEFMREHDKLMRKQCVQKMQQGSLNRLVDAPFMGQSVSHETFKKPKDISKKEMCKPRDELFVANLPLKTGTISQTEYDAKKVDICKFTLNKKKAIFD